MPKMLDVSTTVANSLCRLAKAVSCICSAVYNFPSGPLRSNVAVPSDTIYVLNPRFPAMRVVVETQWSVVIPHITSGASFFDR